MLQNSPSYRPLTCNQALGPYTSYRASHWTSAQPPFGVWRLLIVGCVPSNRQFSNQAKFIQYLGGRSLSFLWACGVSGSRVPRCGCHYEVKYRSSFEGPALPLITVLGTNSRLDYGLRTTHCYLILARQVFLP